MLQASFPVFDPIGHGMDTFGGQRIDPAQNGFAEALQPLFHVGQGARKTLARSRCWAQGVEDYARGQADAESQEKMPAGLQSGFVLCLRAILGGGDVIFEGWIGRAHNVE